MAKNMSAGSLPIAGSIAGNDTSNKSSWPELVSAADTPAPVLKTLTALMEIERMGAEIDVLVADVSDRAQMQTAVGEVLARYGTINGVIHAAGIVQAGMIQTKTRESADAVLAPKD